MDFFEVIRRRRSVREFDAARPVLSKDIETCLEAARLAPSAGNSQSWRFFVAKAPALRAAIAEAGFGQPALRQAPVITVLLGDRGTFKKRTRRAKELADVGALTGEILEIQDKLYGEAIPREEQDNVIRMNCMLAGEHYVLAAAALELGCAWVGMFEAEKLMDALKLDGRVCFPVALLPTGYAKDELLPPQTPRYGLSDMAWRGETGRPWVAGS